MLYKKLWVSALILYSPQALSSSVSSVYETLPVAEIAETCAVKVSIRQMSQSSKELMFSREGERYVDFAFSDRIINMNEQKYLPYYRISTTSNHALTIEAHSYTKNQGGVGPSYRDGIFRYELRAELQAKGKNLKSLNLKKFSKRRSFFRTKWELVDQLNCVQ